MPLNFGSNPQEARGRMTQFRQFLQNMQGNGGQMRSPDVRNAFMQAMSGKTPASAGPQVMPQHPPMGGPPPAAPGATPNPAAPAIAHAMGAPVAGAAPNPNAQAAPPPPPGPENIVPASGGFNQLTNAAAPQIAQGGGDKLQPVGMAAARPAGTFMYGARPRPY